MANHTCPLCGQPRTSAARLCWACHVAPGPRFDANVEVTAHCWIWRGYRIWNGYGRLEIKGQALLAHRYAWERVNGPIPDGLHVLHRCDNRRCVNPSHLFLGTNHDNVLDCVAKGRSSRGERSGRAKLTAADVQRIREIYESKAASLRQLATQFSVSPSVIFSVTSRQSWKSVA